MKKQVIKIIAFNIMIIIINPLNIYAAPTITSFNGSVSKGSSITINGSSFGTKSTAVPIKYDFFENGTGTIKNGWEYSISTDNPVYNSNEPRSGSASHIRCTHGGASRFWYYNNAPLPSLYVTYWMRMKCSEGSSLGLTDNYKLLQIRNSYPGTTSDYPEISVLAKPSAMVNIAGEGAQYLTWASNNKIAKYWSLFSTDVWVRFEYYIKESSMNGFDDGTVIMNIQYGEGNKFTQIINEHTETNISGGTKHFETVVFDAFARTNGTVITNDYDDIYIDNTQARVEIGNEPVWSNCTHREIQIPTQWSSNSIIMTINKGSFSNGESAYLFVIDGNGGVSNGLPIVFGTSSDTLVNQPQPPMDTVPPAAPAGVSISIQ